MGLNCFSIIPILNGMGVEFKGSLSFTSAVRNWGEFRKVKLVFVCSEKQLLGEKYIAL